MPQRQASRFTGAKVTDQASAASFLCGDDEAMSYIAEDGSLVTATGCNATTLTAYTMPRAGASGCADDSVRKMCEARTRFAEISQGCEVILHSSADKLSQLNLAQCKLVVLSCKNSSFFDTQVQTPTGDTAVHYSRTSTSRFEHSGDRVVVLPDNTSVLGHFVTFRNTAKEPVLVLFSGYQSARLRDFGTAICGVYVPAEAATDDVAEGLHVYPLYNRADEVDEHCTMHGFTFVPDSDTTHTLFVHPVQDNAYTGTRIPSLNVGNDTHDTIVRRASGVLIPECQTAIALQRSEEEADAQAAATVAISAQSAVVTPAATATPVEQQQQDTLRVPLRVVVTHKASSVVDGTDVLAHVPTHTQRVLLGLTTTPHDSTTCEHLCAHLSTAAFQRVTSASALQAVLADVTTNVKTTHTFARGLLHGGVALHPRDRQATFLTSDDVDDTMRNHFRLWQDDHCGMVENALFVIVADNAATSAYREANDWQALFGGLHFNINPFVSWGCQVVVMLTDGVFLHAFGTGVHLSVPTPNKGDNVTAAVLQYLAGEGECAPVRVVKKRHEAPKLLLDALAQLPLAELLVPEMTMRLRQWAAIVEMYPSSSSLMRRVTRTLDTREASIRTEAITETTTAEATAEATPAVAVEALTASEQAVVANTVLTAEQLQLRKQRHANTRKFRQLRKQLNHTVFAHVAMGGATGRTVGQTKRHDSIHNATKGKEAVLASREAMSEWLMSDDSAMVLYPEMDVEQMFRKMVYAKSGEYDKLFATSAFGTHTQCPFLDTHTADALLDVIGTEPSHVLAPRDASARRVTLGVPNHTGSSMLLLYLPTYLEDGTSSDEPHFNAACQATSNASAAVWRQVMREVLFSNTRLNVLHRNTHGTVDLPASSCATGWMLASVLLDAAAWVTRNLSLRNTANDYADVVPTVVRRLHCAAAMTLGAGVNPLSTVWTFWRGQPKWFAHKDYEWALLQRVVQTGVFSGYGALSYLQKFVVPYTVAHLYHGIARPIAEVARLLAEARRYRHDENVAAEVGRRTTDEWQHAVAKRIQQVITGEAVTPLDTAFYECIQPTARKNKRLTAFLLHADTVGTGAHLRAQKCCSGVPRWMGNASATDDATFVRHAARFWAGRTHLNALRHLLCSGGLSRTHRVELATTHTLFVLRVLGLGDAGVTCFARQFPDLSLTDAQRAAYAIAEPVDDAFVCGEEMCTCVTQLREWGHPCVFWHGDWHVTAATATTSVGDVTTNDEVRDSAVIATAAPQPHPTEQVGAFLSKLLQEAMHNGVAMELMLSQRLERVQRLLTGTHTMSDQLAAKQAQCDSVDDYLFAQVTDGCSPAFLLGLTVREMCDVVLPLCVLQACTEANTTSQDVQQVMQARLWAALQARGEDRTADEVVACLGCC